MGYRRVRTAVPMADWSAMTSRRWLQLAARHGALQARLARTVFFVEDRMSDELHRQWLSAGRLIPTNEDDDVPIVDEFTAFIPGQGLCTIVVEATGCLVTFGPDGQFLSST